MGEAPEAGHNSALSEAEKQALFLRGLAELEQMIEEKNEIVSDIRNQRKRMVSYGFKAYEIDYALKLRKEEDDEMSERRRNEARIARFLNHPIGSQLDWVEEIDRTPAVDKAFEAGKVAGEQGKSAQPPHSPGTDQEQAWLRGWHEGQDIIASAFKKLEEMADPDDGQADIEDEAA